MRSPACVWRGPQREARKKEAEGTHVSSASVIVGLAGRGTRTLQRGAVQLQNDF